MVRSVTLDEKKRPAAIDFTGATSFEGEGVTFAGFDYGYNAANVLVAEAQTQKEGRGHWYGYDEAYRLTGVYEQVSDPLNQTSAPTSYDREFEYVYDDVGNLTSRELENDTVNFAGWTFSTAASLQCSAELCLSGWRSDQWRGPRVSAVLAIGEVMPAVRHSPNRLRIIAGRFKNRWIEVPKDQAVRPTGDRVREAIFSMLGPDACAQLVVLDAFAGTGAMGLEALSRGAARAVFVERDPSVVAVIDRNIAALGLGPETAVLPGDAFEQGTRLSLLGPFDLVFLDPPYGILRADLGGFLDGVEKLLVGNELLAPDATVVVEHATEVGLPDSLANTARARVRDYGSTTVSLFKR